MDVFSWIGGAMLLCMVAIGNPKPRPDGTMVVDGKEFCISDSLRNVVAVDTMQVWLGAR